MTEPTLRKPTKKAFFFPTSAEVREEKSSSRTAKASRKASKGAADESRNKRVNAKEKPVQTEKKAAEAATEVAVEVEAKGKARRAKKESAKKVSDKKDADKKESVKKEGAKKEKVVRDSFTMPKADYEKIAVLKKKCLDAGITVKKSELLRAGLALLDSTSEKRLLAAIAAVETVKTGRPSKSV